MTNYDEVIAFKKYLEQFNAVVHFHDACGGQSFTLEQTSEKLRNSICEYFKKQGKTVSFAEDNINFIVK